MAGGWHWTWDIRQGPLGSGSWAEGTRQWAVGIGQWVCVGGHIIGAVAGGESVVGSGPKWGDVYLHETAISRIRRLLEEDYRTATLNEPVARFKNRVGAGDGAYKLPGVQRSWWPGPLRSGT